jgi:hypothetical protein
MTQMAYRPDWESFPVYQRLIQSKLFLALEQLKSLENCKVNAHCPQEHTLEDIITSQDDQNDFIGIVQQKCNAWRAQYSLLPYIDSIRFLEDSVKMLEKTSGNILYLAEQFKRSCVHQSYEKVESLQ